MSGLSHHIRRIYKKEELELKIAQSKNLMVAVLFFCCPGLNAADNVVIGEVEMRYDEELGRVVYEPVSIEPNVNVPRVIRK